MRSPWPDGPQLDLFGPPPCPASPSLPLASAGAPSTHVISGPRSSASSASVALALSLGSRLRQHLASAGGTEYAATWRVKATPAGRLYWAHIASARPTGGNDCTGWHTADSQQRGGDYQDGNRILARLRSGHQINLNDQAQLTGCPTPNVPNGGRSIAHAQMHGQTAYHEGKKVPVGLEAIARMAGWASPASRDWRDGRASQDTMQHNSRPLNEQATMLAGWGTPSATERSGQGEANVSLMQQARLAGWGTRGSMEPLTETPRPSRAASGRTTEYLGRQMHGTTMPSSPAGTAKPGALNPAFVCWLMGYPDAWINCAPSAMP